MIVLGITFKIILAFLVSVSFLFLWRLESRCRFVLTPFLLLIYWQFIRILPTFFVADNYGLATDFIPLMVSIVAFFSLLIGFVFSYFFYRASSNQILNFNVQNNYNQYLKFNKIEFYAIILLSFLLIFLGLFYYQGFPATLYSVLGIFSEESNELARLVSSQRVDLTKGAYFGGEYRGQGLIRTILRIGWTLICCYSILIISTKKSIINFVFFTVSFFFAWLFVAGAGDRGPFLDLLIVVFVAYSYYRVPKLRFILLAMFVIIICAIALGSYSAKMHSLLMDSPGSFLYNSFSRILGRIVFGNAVHDVQIIELINNGKWDLRLGSNHIRDFITSLPGVRYGKPLSYDLFMYLNPGSKSTTFASGTYLSKVYVDFSFYGIFPLFFLCGFFVGIIQRFLFTLKPSLINISLAAIIAFYSSRVIASGFHSVIADFFIIFMIIVIHKYIKSILNSCLAFVKMSSSGNSKFQYTRTCNQH